MAPRQREAPTGGLPSNSPSSKVPHPAGEDNDPTRSGIELLLMPVRR